MIEKEPKKIKVVDIVKKEPVKSSFWAAKKAEPEAEEIIAPKKPVEPLAPPAAPLPKFDSAAGNSVFPDLSVKTDREKMAEEFLTKEFRRPEKKDVFTPAYQKHEGVSRGARRPVKALSGLLFLVVLILFGGAVYAGAVYLPKADIKIVIKKEGWEYKNPIKINTKLAEIDVLNRQIPGAIFSERKNITSPYPASGKKFLERKAAGFITIYNNFSGESQVLVAGTRFQEPGGKIFKLEERTTVPGAKASGGSLVPGSVQARVIAEKAGTEYNISPVEKFTIPGFAGTPKFEKFYANSKEAMIGGLVGNGLFATEDDIKKAREKALADLKGALNSFILSQISSQEFKIVDSSSKFNLIKETVGKEVDDSGNFNIYLDGEASVIAFKENHVLALMAELARQVKKETPFLKEFSLQYGNIEIDAKTGSISLPVGFTGVFWNPLETEDFKQKISGKTDEELRVFIKDVYSDRIESANISFWPVWVSKVPADLDRVKVEVE